MRLRHALAFVIVALLAFPRVVLAENAAIVTRVQGKAEAVEAAGSRPLSVGDPIRRGDRLRTGGGARLEVRFADGMDLTLSDGAEMVVSEFDWAPAMSQGKAELALAQGSFLLESGKVGKLPDHPLLVKTPLASVGIRGTKFWGGPLDAPMSILLLEGGIIVTNRAGSVELNEPGAGTSIDAAGGAPAAPSFWGEERIQKAFATVTFGK
ncbi:hypothetical protein CU669_10020 [Paramagnetospirillum kuznetsovii]|uniref:FecR protein domain-containing protein n=1 Tax=Paramagnetospirillum kuznetsovii TaxID=2053833 RepID=A0A364NY59_9PROT|nr:FecR family protein [Paramagnetospirillum kuznetsovii]RAU22024.1 hypothetical protein CU669_10020 [Paramagnetospirillum kuznetsovii]